MTEGKAGKRVRRSRGEWRLLLAGQSGSGLDVEAYCRREAISAASFYRWRRVLAHARDGGNDVVEVAVPGFVDLGAVNAGYASRARIDLKLELGDGLVVHLVRG
jgi:hypothetical protein